MDPVVVYVMSFRVWNTMWACVSSTRRAVIVVWKTNYSNLSYLTTFNFISYHHI